MNKQMRVLLSMILCFCLATSAAFPVFAEEIEQAEEIPVVKLTISTLEEFLSFAESSRLDSYSQNLEVLLEADIDLCGTEFSGIPIFSGTFEGNGHKITGLQITDDGSVQGLFRYLTETSVVRNLTVQGEVAPKGSRAAVGGIAGSNAGKIENCIFTGAVSGGDSVGGLVGINAVTGIIDGCSVEGIIHGNHFVGGIAGENYGVIRNSTNAAEVNTTAQQNSVDISDITMDTLTNSEAVNTVTDIGGIAGTSSGVIRECENRGDVGYPQMGYNIGGIAGSQTGYIVSCANYAKVSGRKEVGGIVGQMEPVALIEYSVDTLQILQGQMETVSGLANRASSNAQTNASNITGQIALLEDQAETAREAIETLFPDEENPERPDADTILAAQNALSSSISAMPGTLNGIAVATQNTVSTLSRDMQALAGQIGAMGQTLNGASENLGGSITDVSDMDTAEDLTGKVEGCVNYGGVLADLNAGGITGAMAFENDLDHEDDLQISGDSSLNFDSQLRTVVLNCENEATVTVNKQNAGGIVGWQSMGLVKNCLNSGALDAEAADYVGGIAGRSSGFVRFSSAKCEVFGNTYVGGIAGSGTIVSDCRSMVLLSGSEKSGAVLGHAQDGYAETEKPIQGNLYLSVHEDLGGIDGISYAGQAEPLARDEFLALENLPEVFQNISVTFVFEDGAERTVFVVPGGRFSAADIPAVPAKDGYIGVWDGLEETDLSSVVFDMTFEAVYTKLNAVIQSSEVRENGLPVLLVQGSFSNSAAVTAARSADIPTLEEGQHLVEAWSFAVSEESARTARFLLPVGQESDWLMLLIRKADGSWEKAEYTLDGSYLVFSIEGGAAGFAIAETEPPVWPWIAAAVCAAVLAVVLLIVLWPRKMSGKRNNGPREEKSENNDA